MGKMTLTQARLHGVSGGHVQIYVVAGKLDSVRYEACVQSAHAL